MEIRISSNPQRSLAEAFVIPEWKLYQFRIIFFPMQLVWRTPELVTSLDLLIQFRFPPFRARRAMRILGIGLVNHKSEYFSYNETDVAICAGDIYNLTYDLTLPEPHFMRPLITDMEELRRQRS